MRAATESLPKLSIERAQGLTPAVFEQRYLAGSGKPVVVTDVVKSWKALNLWSFDLLRARYGTDQISPRIFLRPKVIKPMTLAEYFDYLDAPETLPRGFWIDAVTLHPRDVPAEVPQYSLYLGWNVFVRHPELLDDIQLSPTFAEDWLPLLPGALRKTMDEATRYFAAGLMIGCGNGQLGLHYDFLDTHAYLAQIIGKKRCLLFSPEDSAALYDGEVDPDDPDFEKFPLFRNATAYECILEPGELLFIPYRWWHHVVSLEKSITVNYNFFNRVNFGGYLTNLLRALPAVVDGLAQSPDARAALGIDWTCRGFDSPNSGRT